MTSTPDRDEVVQKIRETRHKLMIAESEYARLDAELFYLQTILESLTTAAVPDDRDADEPVVVGHRPS